MSESTIKLTPFLSLNGRAVEAIEFYKKHLGAQVVFLKSFEDMKEYDPKLIYDELKAKYISHSVLVIGQSQFSISDEIMTGDKNLNPGNLMSLCIESASLDDVKNVFHSLTSEDLVKVIVPFAKNAFSPGYGIIEDPFGVIIQLFTRSR